MHHLQIDEVKYYNANINENNDVGCWSKTL